MQRFKKLLRIAERHTKVPASTRKAVARAPGPFESIDGGTLGEVIGGRVVATGATDPKLLQGIQGLSQAMQAAGQAIAGKQVKDSQQGLQMMGEVMQRRGGGGEPPRSA